MRKLASWVLLTICFGLFSCTKEEETEALPEAPLRETLHVLAFGNSFTQDALAYVPFLFESMNTRYNLDLELACLNSGKLEDHLNILTEGGDYYCNIHYPGSDVWTERYWDVYHLLSLPWDLILFNQESQHSTDYDSYEESVPLLLEYVYENLNYPATLGWLMPHTLPQKNHLELFEQQSACIQRICSDYAIEVVLPCGTATENARQTSLKDIANGRLLTCEDNWHLQDGVPCLTEAYAATGALFQWLGIKEDRLPLYRIDKHFATEHKIPGVNGTTITGSMPQLMKARECANLAVMNPFEVTSLQRNNLLREYPPARDQEYGNTHRR